MTKTAHAEWMRWAAAHASAEIDAALETAHWINSRPAYSPAALPLCATPEGIHYLTQERGNRRMEAR